MVTSTGLPSGNTKSDLNEIGVALGPGESCSAESNAPNSG